MSASDEEHERQLDGSETFSTIATAVLVAVPLSRVCRQPVHSSAHAWLVGCFQTLADALDGFWKDWVRLPGKRRGLARYLNDTCSWPSVDLFIAAVHQAFSSPERHRNPSVPGF